MRAVWDLQKGKQLRLCTDVGLGHPSNINNNGFLAPMVECLVSSQVTLVRIQEKPQRAQKLASHYYLFEIMANSLSLH